MHEIQNEWFETGEVEGRTSYYSKFSKKDFTIPVEALREQWPQWNSDEKRKFAWAFGFSGKTELNEEEQRILEFLVQNGNPDIWRAIAPIVGRHPDRRWVVSFLLSRLNDETEHLANYYQALGTLSPPECVPILADKLANHHRKVVPHTAPGSWGESSLYSDYLSCSAALFRITGQEKYRDNLRKILGHPEEKVRQKVRTIAASNGFEL